MKKFALLALLSVGLVGCSGSTAPAPSNTPAAGTPAEVAPPAPADAAPATPPADAAAPAAAPAESK